MHLLIVSATPFEIAPTISFLEENFSTHEPGFFEKENLCVTVLLTGVGMTATALHLGHFFAQQTPDVAINAGIAGAFDRALRLGDVVQVHSECFGDLGVEEADGRFTDLFDLGLSDPDQPPFSGGMLRHAGAEQQFFLPSVSGLTVNRVHGSAASIDAVRRIYPSAQIETMEGAAFFYACLLRDVSFLEVRAISNYVEARNREAWQIGPAIENLNKVLVEMLGVFGA